MSRAQRERSSIHAWHRCPDVRSQAGNLGVGQARADGRMIGQQPRGLVGQQLPELPDGGVGLLGHVQLGQATVAVDHEQRRGVVDLPLFDRHLDLVGLPHLFELGRRAGEEMPAVDHAVQLGVGAHVRDRRRAGIGVDAQQLHPGPGRSEHRLGIHHRGGGQRADRRALGVVERQDHHLAAERAQRHPLAELVGEREVGRPAR